MSQSLGTLLARLGADTTQFDAALTRSQMRMKAVGKTMKRIGMSMSMALTLPLALIGAASFKMAKDFETSLSKVIGLVGVAREQVNVWKDEILAMAPAVGKMPKELGEALFFVTSAGIRGAEAMDVLRVSAQAASAGLGETKTVADLVTSAMNAYGSANLNATQATDVLVAAVREGKAEASALAESMGMVLPIASEMGVKFYEVGAAVAAMTRTGTNAATASMQLRQILASLIKPTDQAKEALIKMGTTASEMRRIIREDGLIVALQKLKKITSEYGEEAMAKVFPNIRALSGVLDIMGSNAEDNIAIFDRMSDSTGSLDRAFEAAARTTDFKWNAAMSRGSVALIKLGNVVKEMVMPIITGFSRIIEGLGKWFEGLSDSGKKLVVVIAGITMIVGPLLIVLGFLASTVLPMLVAGFATLNAVILANPIAALITVLALVATAMLTFKKRVREIIPFQTQFTNLLSKEKTKLDSLFTSLDNAAEGTRERKKAIDLVNKLYGEYLPNLLDEKSSTEDIAKAYELINTAMRANIALKAKKEKIDSIINKSLQDQEKIINKVVAATKEYEGPVEAALAFERVYDIVDELSKKKILIPIDIEDITQEMGSVLSVMQQLREAGSKIQWKPGEIEAAVKILKLQNQQQMDLNNTSLFFEQILKGIDAALIELNETRTKGIEGQKEELKTIESLGTTASALSDVLEYLGFDYVDLEKMGSDAIQKLADIVVPNMDRIKKKLKDVKQEMKDSIPTILEYRTAFEGFDVMEGVFDAAADTVAIQMENLKHAMRSGLESLAVTFAEGLGDLMAGEATFKDFGKSILYGIGQFLKQIGGSLIVFSGLMAAFEDFAISNPYLAIALGIAAIAAGQLLMSQARKGPNVQGLATGGVVTSEGIFEVGERGKETVYLPAGSAVTPHKAGGAQEIFGIIRGEDIYMSNKRYIDKLGRVT